MKNSGVVFINNVATLPETTVIISGVGRCGTSMAAAVLNEFGLNLGEFEPTVFEDTHMHFALKHWYHEARYQIISYRNAHFPKWGFKFPGIQNHLQPPELSAHFRNPRIVIMQRDNSAVAARLLISDRLEFKTEKAALLHAAKQQLKIIEWAIDTECPVAVFSYEKFITKPQSYIECLISFCGITLEEEQLKSAIKKVMPNEPDYINMFADSIAG
jgi:hypothetical protein